MKRWPKWYKIDRLIPGEVLGSLQAERIRCGKANCRCASGLEEVLHGPYWYRYWRDENGKQRKSYVKQSELDEVRHAIARRQFRLEREREQRKKHMRRGKYSWKAQHRNSDYNPMFEEVRSGIIDLHRLRALLRQSGGRDKV